MKSSSSSSIQSGPAGPHWASPSMPADASNEIAQRTRVVQQVIKARRSTRRFAAEPIVEADLLELVEAGIYAPSGSNSQNQRFLIVSDKQEIERIGRIRYVWPYKTRGPAKQAARERNPAGILGHATALIFVFADAMENHRAENGEYHIWEPLDIQNCAASIQNILLLATAKGLASCWVSATEGMAYSRLLSQHGWQAILAPYEVPNHYKIQGIVVLGKPHAVDEEGFSRGEKKHGATHWHEVEREPIEHYLIAPRAATAAPLAGLGWMPRIQRRLYVALLRRLLRMVRRLDAKVTRIDLQEVSGNDRAAQ